MKPRDGRFLDMKFKVAGFLAVAMIALVSIRSLQAQSTSRRTQHATCNQQ